MLVADGFAQEFYQRTENSNTKQIQSPDKEKKNPSKLFLWSQHNLGPKSERLHSEQNYRQILTSLNKTVRNISKYSATEKSTTLHFNRVYSMGAWIVQY